MAKKKKRSQKRQAEIERVADSSSDDDWLLEGLDPVTHDADILDRLAKQEAARQNWSAQQELLRNDIIRGRTPITVFKKVLRNQSKKDTKALEGYAQRGTEINAGLRRKDGSRDDDARRITSALRRRDYGTRYVYVYRNSTAVWNDWQNSGFLSTSNRALPFGMHHMKIRVDTHTKHTGVIDISKHTEKRDTYELVLPTTTQLRYVGKDTHGVLLYTAE